MSPAGSIALLLVGLFALFVLIGWYCRKSVHGFVQALYRHRQKIRERSEAAQSTTSTAGSSV